MATAILYLILAGAVIALLFALQGLVTLFRVRVPFVTTPDWVINWLCTHTNLKPGQTFVELGCGDARVLAALAGRFPQTIFIGYELAWWPYLLARWRTRMMRNVRIERKNFMTVSLQSAHVLFCYLITSVMPTLAAKLQRELPADAVVYSHAFRLPDWEPIKSISAPTGPERVSLWVYRQNT